MGDWGHNIRMTLDLNNVPDGLAPTWEQWFNPANPGVR